MPKGTIVRNVKIKNRTRMKLGVETKKDRQNFVGLFKHIRKHKTFGFVVKP